MNCNPCCGCFPPITTYNPSVADNFPTILQQVEYLKALLKKYPSQQWFITQEKVTEETKFLNKLSILSNGREPQGGDFILGNKENGTTLLFQYTGVITEYVNYNLIYVGVFTNQDIADEALAKAQDAGTKAQDAGTKAQQALDLATTNEQNIVKLDSKMVDKVDKIPKGTKYRVYAIEDEYGPPLNYLEVTNSPLIGQLPNYSMNGTLKGNEAKENDDYVNFGQLKTINSKIIKLHKNDINDGVKDTAAAGIFFADGDYSPTFQSFIKRATGELYVKMPLPIIKTLFGKKLYGTGNIDLYKHSIKITANISGYGATYAEIYFDEFSSKNTVVDSIEDLKTLLGNTFEKPVSGIAASDTADLQIMYITQEGMYGYGKNWTFASATNIEITDAITTI